MLPNTNSVSLALETALYATTSRNLEQAVTAILSAWQLRKDSTLTDLLNFFDTKLVKKQIAPVGMNGFSNRTQAWLDRSSQMNIIDIPVLLDFIRQEIAVTPSLMVLSIELAKERPADPRIARELFNYIIKPPFRSTKGTPYYGELLHCIKSIDDPALYIEIITLAEQYRGTQRVVPGLGRKNMPIFYALAEYFSQKQSIEPLTKIELDLCQEIKQQAEKIIPTDNVADSLLRNIYASPADISVRLVYADHLMKKELDPRGEFIALQCASTKNTLSAREKDLLKTYGRHWLDALEPFLARSDVIYQNGFLKACKFNQLADKHSAIGFEQWSTVTDIDISQSSESIAIILDPIFKSLRRVYGLSSIQLSKVCKHTQPLSWTDIHFKYTSIIESAKMLADSRCLSKIVGLEYDYWTEKTLFDFLSTPFGKQLTRIRLPNYGQQWSLVRQEILQQSPNLNVLEYINGEDNSRYAAKLNRYSGWLISMVGTGTLDKIIATYMESVSLKVVSSFFKETKTIRWQDMSRLMIKTPKLLNNLVQDAIVRKCRKYNNRIDIKFLTLN